MRYGTRDNQSFVFIGGDGMTDEGGFHNRVIGDPLCYTNLEVESG